MPRCCFCTMPYKLLPRTSPNMYITKLYHVDSTPILQVGKLRPDSLSHLLKITQLEMDAVATLSLPLHIFAVLSDTEPMASD